MTLKFLKCKQNSFRDKCWAELVGAKLQIKTKGGLTNFFHELQAILVVFQLSYIGESSQNSEKSAINIVFIQAKQQKVKSKASVTI